MGNSGTKPIFLNSFDDLPANVFQIYLEKAKHEINDQYDSDNSVIYFPYYGDCTINMDNGKVYSIITNEHKKLDKELELYCKELIRRPYVLIGRTIHLVENYN
jgi:hypothetical protein